MGRVEQLETSDQAKQRGGGVSEAIYALISVSGVATFQTNEQRRVVTYFETVTMNMSARC